jgi:hypothetical protein
VLVSAVSACRLELQRLLWSHQPLTEYCRMKKKCILDSATFPLGEHRHTRECIDS